MKRQFHQRRAELESVPLLDCSMVVSQEVGLVGRSVCALISTSPERTHSLAASPTVRWAPSLPLSLPGFLYLSSLLCLSAVRTLTDPPTLRSQPSAGFPLSRSCIYRSHDARRFNFILTSKGHILNKSRVFFLKKLF